MKTKHDSTIEMVEEFHITFGHPVNDIPNVRDMKLNELRVNLIEEELNELKDALIAMDPAEAFDALCDLQYVLDGAFLALGFHNMKQEGVAEVHASNMSKLGDDGKPIYREEDGKVLKGPNYRKPDLRVVLDKYKGDWYDK